MSHLNWGGVDCLELAERFGTPLYVINEEIIRARCAELRRDFLDRWPRTRAAYAGKAFLTRTMARIVDQEGLSLDVVSLGELHIARSANFPSERIEMNGNAKSLAEIDAALGQGGQPVGRIIVDSLTELEVLCERISTQGRGASPKILLRVAPGVDAHTHAYITTGQTGSKFGLPLEGDMLPRAIRFAQSRGLNIQGLHFHVGSQLFDPDAHVGAVLRIVNVMKDLRDTLGFEVEELNVGGGLGAVSNPSQPHVSVLSFMDAIMTTLERECERCGLERPLVSIEPGRWIISEAGITLYRVEVVKELAGLTYIAVDGGMADNPRYPLYNALYDCAVVSRPEIAVTDETMARDWNGAKVSIVGKCCESGDILIDNARLPRVERGDIIALYNSGAYTYSMSSNYNALCRPAVVLVGEGRAELIVKRQTPDDLISGDVIPDRLN